MNVTDLEYGAVLHCRVVPRTGNAFPGGVRPGREARLWKDEGSGLLLLRQGNEMCPLREEAASSRVLEDLCAANRPRVVWVADRKRGPGGDCVLLQVHQFPREIVFPAVDLAVDDRVVESAPRLNPRRVEDVVEWLTDQCLLPLDNATEGCRAFLSAGAEKRLDEAQAFVLHGKALRVFVRRLRQETEEGEVREWLAVDRVARSRGSGDREAVFLASGAIRFRDRTVTGMLRESAAAELTSLTQADESFMRVWQKYGEMEEKVIFERVRLVGLLPYDNHELLPDGSVRFDLTGAETAERLAALKAGDELEAAGSVPDLERLTGGFDGQPARKRQAAEKEDRQFLGEVVEAPNPASRSVVLRAEPGQTPSPTGVLHVSIQGDRRRLERRREVQEKIRTGRCAMPHLGLILEGADTPYARHLEHKAVTPRVLAKVFTRDGKVTPPTPRQEAAIRAALNTPDIALIQGPPGTGKTTVIRAIIERLNEIADGNNGVSGSFLVTGFQHDAVENAIGKLDVNELPAIKFGTRGKRDGYEEAEARIDRWRQEKAAKVRERMPATDRAGIQERLRDLVHAYVLAPSDLPQAVALLDEVAALVRGKVSVGFLEELRDLREQLTRNAASAGPMASEAAQVVRAVRALRTTDVAFADDGPQTALQALVRLGRSGFLDAAAERLLRQAAEWTVRQGQPPFLAGLADLRHRLLVQLLPASSLDGPPRVRRDVADLLGRVQEELEGRFRASGSAADAATTEFLHELENNPEAVKQAIIDYTAVYAATCQQSASQQLADVKRAERLEYDSVLVDEAARANPLDLLIPMSQGRRRIIMVGDHRQLPHIIDDEIERELDEAAHGDLRPIAERVNEIIRESLFQRLFSLAQEREAKDHIPRAVTLDEQYRMHPTLGAFVSGQFYERYGEGFGSGFPAEDFGHALDGYEGQVAAWLDVPLHRGKEERGKSKSRPVEAQVIAAELQRLIDSPAAQTLTFGIITFYSAQVGAIGAELSKRGLMVSDEDAGYRVADTYRDLTLPNGKVVERLRVGTVDAFQGKEFDVVLLSMVRSNRLPDGEEKERRAKYGHLMSPNRLCVSMSRQKRLLIVCGDAEMLRSAYAREAIGPLVAFHELCGPTTRMGARTKP